MADYYDMDKVKTAANGSWGKILSYLCPELDRALELAGRHSACPRHEGKNNDGLRVFKDYRETGGCVCNTCGVRADGFSTIMWITGWTFAETLGAVARTIGVESEGNSNSESTSTKLPPRVVIETLPPVDTSIEDRKLAERFCRSLNKTWDESYPLDAPEAEPVRLYLASRGLTSRNLPPTLRFHPSLAYYDNKEEKITGNYPAMIGLVQDISGKPITLHRTYLTIDGQKAPVKSPKKIMSYPKIDRDLSGASIHLSPAAPTMGTAEGLETGLSIRQATNASIWVAVSSNLMEVLELPEICTSVVAWADKDLTAKNGKNPGLDSAKKFIANQWSLGRKAGLVLPDLESGDWNDVLLQQGIDGFPKLDSLKRSIIKAA